MADNPLQDQIAEQLGSAPGWLLVKDLAAVMGVPATKLANPVHSRPYAEALANLGFERFRRRVGGGRTYVWIRDPERAFIDGASLPECFRLASLSAQAVPSE